jgi:hypothetical protein
MSPTSSTFQQVLRRLVLRLVLLLDTAMGVRGVAAAAGCVRLPEGHRRRRAIEAELRRIARYRADSRRSGHHRRSAVSRHGGRGGAGSQ